MKRPLKRPTINNAMGERIWSRIVQLHDEASEEEAASINPKQLSVDAGLSATYIRDLLREEDPNPRVQHFRALAKRLGVSIEWIETGRGVGQVDPGLQDVIDFWGDIPDRHKDTARQMLEGLTAQGAKE